MTTLILYSSHDGQTKKIAEFIAARLEGDIQVCSLTEEREIDIESVDKIVIGASIRYGHFDRKLYEFIKRHHVILNQKSAVFFGVNLTARKDGKDTPETNVYVKKFLTNIEWKPKFAAVFAGALFYPRYKWFDRVMIQFIMRLTGGETDPTKEVEYTNWEQVERFTKNIKTLT